MGGLASVYQNQGRLSDRWSTTVLHRPSCRGCFRGIDGRQKIPELEIVSDWKAAVEPFTQCVQVVLGEQANGY
jgi:hypothetical protein